MYSPCNYNIFIFCSISLAVCSLANIRWFPAIVYSRSMYSSVIGKISCIRNALSRLSSNLTIWRMMWYKKVDTPFSRIWDIIKRMRREQNGRKQAIWPWIPSTGSEAWYSHAFPWVIFRLQTGPFAWIIRKGRWSQSNESQKLNLQRNFENNISNILRKAWHQ